VADPADYARLQAGDVLRLTDLRCVLTQGDELAVENVTRQATFQVRHHMTPRQVLFLLRGRLINWMRERLSGRPGSGDALTTAGAIRTTGSGLET
jgi:aconitate hydratase